MLTDYFTDREDALRQYEKFWSIYEHLPKKGVVFDPCIFPWYRVELKPSEIICHLSFTAYVLGDEEKITQMASLLGEVAGGSYDRGYLLNLLLYHPANQTQRELLIRYMGNTEEFTSSKAAALVKKLSFTETDYRLMEDMLRFKRDRLRSRLLEMLEGQDDQCMEGCLKRLLADKKEEKRSAGLDLLLRLSKKPDKAEFYHRVKSLAGTIQKPTDKEKILIEEMGLTVTGQTPDGGKRFLRASDQKGFGIYDPDALPDIPDSDEGCDEIHRCLPLSEKEVIAKIKKLDAVIRENRDYEYETASGDKMLLGNAYMEMGQKDSGQRNLAGRGHFSRVYRLKNYPLEDKLRAYYEEEIGDYGTFVEWEARMLLGNEESYQGARVFYEAVFGKMPFKPEPMAVEYGKQMQNIRLNYRYEFMDRKLLFRAGVQAAQALCQVISPKNKMVPFHYAGWNGKQNVSWVSTGDLRFMDRFLEGLGYWETDEEFARAFFAAWKLELACSEAGKNPRFLQDTGQYNSLSARMLTPLAPYWFLKAYHMGLVTKDILYQAVLDYFNRKDNLQALTQLVKGEYAKPMNRALWRRFFGEDAGRMVSEQGEAFIGKDTWCGSLVQELYDTVVPLMTDTELRRGEAETVFSKDIAGITYIRGIPYLIRILKALGKDTLGREAYYYSSDVEAPTLEWVEFSDRKTFESLAVGQVPDLIYSEVMRDVDLAVSVAHAGGVDPQTSHSTIEMRRAVVEFNLPLFQIDNVVLKDSHALIHGTRGNYNVHLGSGVVHQEDGAMLNILPVHSQKRGKLFLPFVDEDPKTAEIMSKIVLLAQDKKIRDPFILEQICDRSKQKG